MIDAPSTVKEVKMGGKGGVGRRRGTGMETFQE
jgi:hypothetical protein